MVEGTDKVSTLEERRSLIWKSSDGEKCPITELEDRHLVNILNYMYRKLRKNLQDSFPDEMVLRALRNRDRVFYHLEAEAESRGLFWRQDIEKALAMLKKENDTGFSVEEGFVGTRIIEV